MNPWDNYTAGTDWWKQRYQGAEDQDDIRRNIYNSIFGRDMNLWEGLPERSAMSSGEYRPTRNLDLPFDETPYFSRNGITFSGISMNDRINNPRQFYNTQNLPPMYSGRSLWDQISTTRGY